MDILVHFKQNMADKETLMKPQSAHVTEHTTDFKSSETHVSFVWDNWTKPIV